MTNAQTTKGTQRASVRNKDVPPAFTGAWDETSRSQLSPDGQPKEVLHNKSLLGRLKAALAVLARSLWVGYEPHCRRCQSDRVTIVNTTPEDGYGWWAVSHQYRCSACDYTWERWPLTTEELERWE
ncbi:MAG: hypothetical protein HW403_792 [Dehalococcoidia bacterium]|nr:hypothetical protein [Dehalococcoidia bacterium]